MTPRVNVKKLIRRWSISSSARCCDRHGLLMISWFTTMSLKNVSDNGSDWCTTKPTDFHQLQESSDWTQFTEDTESAFAQTTIPTNIHTANIIFTNSILMADKHNITKGKMHSNCRLLSDHIVCKITQRNNIRRANTCDPALKRLNEEITSVIQKHKQNIWKEHLDAHWDHRYDTHILWKIIHGLFNRAPPPTLNTSITFSNKTATTPKHIANCFTKQFTNTVKHATNRQTYTLPEQHKNRRT